MQTIYNITDLIPIIKFGYTGDTIDLIYLLLFFVLIVFPLGKFIYKKIFNKKGCGN